MGLISALQQKVPDGQNTLEAEHARFFFLFFSHTGSSELFLFDWLPYLGLGVPHLNLLAEGA